MTDNLQNKFTNLENLITAQHNALTELWTATNNKLDAIITALGAPPPTGTTTLADVASILSAIHLDTQSLDLKLLRIRDAISPLEEQLPAVSLAWSSYRLMDATAPSWPRPASMPLQPAIQALYTYLQESFGVNTGGAETALLGLVADLISNVGLPVGDATTTVLGRLAAIQRQQLLCCFSSDPAVADPMGCTSPIASQAPAVIDSAYPGRLFVRWPDMTAQGVVFTSELGLTATAVEITPEATWSGWKLFVGSKTAAVYSEDPVRTGYWPTNQWRDLTEAQGYPLAISVAAGQDVTAYLCPPVPEPEPECVQSEATLDGVNNVWIAYNPGNNTVFWNGDYRNYRIRIVGTYTGGALPRVHCYRYPGDTSLGSLIMNPEFGTQEYTITTPGNEPIAFITIFAFIPNGGAQFTVEMCRPIL